MDDSSTDRYEEVQPPRIWVQEKSGWRNRIYVTDPNIVGRRL